MSEYIEVRTNVALTLEQYNDVVSCWYKWQNT